ncbi:hypothetical protein J2X86_000306 [Acinetobacter lwoffii]|uniref:Phage protein n=1 Tax=Acinetobacter lwoffii TaxID=28090 RepID=A0AAW8L9Y3_ACILW|nr:hypothetical protein [Acinetobacter lwoffii]MDR6628318.1 hypothetical protein [Acinetobacter lwoffii]
MDIQKEKIAHEKHLLSQGVDFKYLPNIKYNELENAYELIEWDEEYSEALNEINSSWCTWQAVKAQAVPEGYVLMPIKPTETMVMAVVKEHEGDAFLPYSLYDAYVKQAMIEAQEPAND